jgi:chromosome segregation ATPase
LEDAVIDKLKAERKQVEDKIALIHSEFERMAETKKKLDESLSRIEGIKIGLDRAIQIVEKEFTAPKPQPLPSRDDDTDEVEPLYFAPGEELNEV